MLIEFCLPKSGKAVPSGPDWLHEVKYDGYRLRLERDGDRVRLFSRGGHDWGTLDRRDRPEDPEDAVHHRRRGCGARRGGIPASTTTRSSYTPSTA
jgi:hypothetical protein